MLLNARDFAYVDDALAAATDGDTIYFPAWKPYAPHFASGWLVNKSITLLGDGPGGDGTAPGAAAGTVLQSTSDANPLITIVPPAKQVHVRRLQLVGTGATAGAGAGIVCEGSTSNPYGASGLTFNDVTIRGFPGDGMRLAGYDAAGAAISRVTIADSTISGCGVGIRLVNSIDIMIKGVLCRGNRNGGCSAETSNLLLAQCTFQGNAAAVSGSLDANLKLDRCPMASVDGCRFIDVDIAGSKRACCVNMGTAIISACYFSAGSSSGTEGIVLTGSGGGPYGVLSQRFKNIATLVRADGGIRNLMLFAQYDESSTGGLNIAAGANVHGAPHVVRPSGSLYAGLSVPTFAGDPTLSVVPGMLVYNTSLGKLRFRTSSQWKTVSTS